MRKRLLVLASASALALGACVSDPYDYDDDYERVEEGVVILDDRYDRNDRYERRAENCYDRDYDGVVERHECYDRDYDIADNHDVLIRRDVLNQLDRYDLREVNVRVEDRDVYLSGWVDSYGDLDLARNIVERIRGVDDVYDRDLRVG